MENTPLVSTHRCQHPYDNDTKRVDIDHMILGLLLDSSKHAIGQIDWNEGEKQMISTRSFITV